MAVKRQLMGEQWDQFSRLVMPKDASSVQRQEMRRAFYAGAEAIMFRVITALAPESEPTEADLRMMDDLQQELQDFAQLVKQGRA